MPLKSQHYEPIMRRYEQIRDENRRLAEERLAEVSERIPEFEGLNQKIREISMERARQLLNSEDVQLSSLHDKIRTIIAQKKSLLLQNGFPEDYLEPIYNCPDCQDTGYILTPEQVRVKCHCLRSQEIEALYEQSNIRDILSRENFSNLSYEYYQGEDLMHFERAVKICKNFVQNYEQDYQNLFFYGTVGSGKSFLSGCVAEELLKQGHSVIYFSSVGLFDTLSRFTFDTKEKESLHDFYDDLYNCDLVIIDDLGTELTNAFVASQLFSCLSERLLRRKATIISTNLSLEELRDRYSDRVFSRITSNYILCKLTGPDIRMVKKCSSPA